MQDLYHSTVAVKAGGNEFLRASRDLKDPYGLMIRVGFRVLGFRGSLGAYDKGSSLNSGPCWALLFGQGAVLYGGPHKAPLS